MASHRLRLTIDRFAAGAALSALASGCNRVIYVPAGSAGFTSGDALASLAPNSAWHGRGEVAIRAGAGGAELMRYELLADAAPAALAEGEGIVSRTALDVPVSLPDDELLMRCDRVDFPPGGVAYTHTHRGPGIRCVQGGAIRIDTGGASHHYAPGEAWFESGPDPVFAAGSETEPTHFIRVMILPRALLGKSSISYVRPEDKDKPKRQSYQIFVDAPIEP
jgi:quercetin dioxygenase-like cupin family protein